MTLLIVGALAVTFSLLAVKLGWAIPTNRKPLNSKIYWMIISIATGAVFFAFITSKTC
ncbi:hypothetical protein [Pseudomonas sp. Leaf127]|uniref:hypothetical protein n=1 Tax=Pseudomonas sp. Leaf127 TaxID=1736267 RepID=UPI000ACAFACC|nr:hypothetical protein [Pseudomonas sp. Leaf127]